MKKKKWSAVLTDKSHDIFFKFDDSRDVEILSQVNYNYLLHQQEFNWYVLTKHIKITQWLSIFGFILLRTIVKSNDASKCNIQNEINPKKNPLPCFKQSFDCKFVEYRTWAIFYNKISTNLHKKPSLWYVI